MCRVAMLSVHGSPLGQLGTDSAGGMQLYIRALSRELGRRGTVVDVFTRRSDPCQPKVVSFGPNARVIHLDAGPAAPIEKNAVLNFLPEFLCNLQRFRQAVGLEYDVIHSHYWLSGWVGNLLARRWGVPHVAMFHTLGRLKNQALAEKEESDARIEIEERIVDGADRIIASSEHERLALVDHYGARWENIAVIPCGVDLSLFRPMDQAAARAMLELDGEVLLFVGRIDPVKGLDVLLQAVALLRTRPNLTLVVVGGSDTERELQRNRRLAHDLGLDGRVFFKGAVPQEKLPIYYSAATLCVVPSYYESFGLVAMEALACGTPVIASEVGGLPTVVRDRENGLLVPRHQPEVFAQRIAQALDDVALRRALRLRARASVLCYDWGIIAERMIAMYHGLTGTCGHDALSVVELAAAEP
jgi:D-inositol-3-phosphate glycosyltransferase